MRTSLADGTTYTVGSVRFYEAKAPKVARDMYLLMQRHYDISKGTLCQQTKRCRPSSFDFKVRDATEVND